MDRVVNVVNAWNDGGIDPEFHEITKKILRKYWPVLAAAVDDLASNYPITQRPASSPYSADGFGSTYLPPLENRTVQINTIGMRYIVRHRDDIAMTQSVHHAKLLKYILMFTGTPDIEIYDNITKRIID